MDKKIKEINKKPEKLKVEKDVKKKVVRGSFSTLMIVLVVAIVVVLNIVASFVETDLGLKLDMTSNKIYTLSPLTESIVSQTDEELIIYSFANDNVQDNMIQKTLERYAALSSKSRLQTRPERWRCRESFPPTVSRYPIEPLCFPTRMRRFSA